MMTSDMRYIPAEWQTGQSTAVLMALPAPHTDWNYMLDEAIDCYRRMIDAIAEHAVVLVLTPDRNYAMQHLSDLMERHPGRIVAVEMSYNDTWTRDYGPICGADGCLHDFTFNAWGMKFAADADNQVNRRLSEISFFPDGVKCHKQMVLEGGSIDSDGEGNILTTSQCLLSPNRNPWMSRSDIETALCDILGARKILWLEHGWLAGDDTDSHVDTLARFAPDRQIVYVHCTDNSDEHFMELDAMRKEIESLTDADGRHFNTVGLPMPSPVYDEDGNRLPATYANYLVLPDAVIVPTYSQPQTDELALRMLEVVYDREVIGVDCLALVRQHGSLHCSTMQMPLNVTVLS